ncbi:MAG: hypothetical protein LBU32_18355 [Clostridiales bacterium]|jgi:flagellar motor protein MotB|nr:hypothetical protein [Clostridiales bacterium]
MGINARKGSLHEGLFSASSVFMALAALAFIFLASPMKPSAAGQAHADMAQETEFDEEIVKKLADEYLEKNIVIEKSAQGGLSVSFPEALLFKRGRAHLSICGEAAVSEMALRIRALDPSSVAVIGRPAGLPPENPNLPDGWSLSSLRAVAVAEKMIEAGIDASLVEAAGRKGDFSSAGETFAIEVVAKP